MSMTWHNLRKEKAMSKGKTWQRVASAFLAAVMTFSTFSTTIAYAAEATTDSALLRMQYPILMLQRKLTRLILPPLLLRRKQRRAAAHSHHSI